MQYLTYEEYVNIGGVLAEAAFKRNIDRACGMINNATFNRILSMDKVPAQVKPLCRDLVDYIDNNMSAQGMVSSRSQSSGGVSESESYTIKSKEEQLQDIDDMICDHLLSVNDDNGTPLLYRGCSL